MNGTMAAAPVEVHIDLRPAVSLCCTGFVQTMMIEFLAVLIFLTASEICSPLVGTEPCFE